MIHCLMICNQVGSVKQIQPGGKNTVPPVAEAAVIADRIAAVSSVEPSPTAPYVLTLN